MNKLIPVLSADSFIRFNNWLGDADGHLNPVFIGEFKHPSGNIEAFCKLYDPTKKGLINEIVGFLAAHALGISQPEYAFVATLPIKALPGFKAVANRQGNAWMKNQTKQVLCFCTSRLDGHSAAIHIKGTDMPERIIAYRDLAADIASWKEYAAAIALDENIAHTDRHFNNLLRLSKQSYAVIDNGRLINALDEAWDCDMLHPDQEYDNRLLKALEFRGNVNKPSTNDVQNAAIYHAEHHEQQLKNIDAELLFWLNALLNEQEYAAFTAFFTDRTKGLPCLLKRRFHKLV